MADNVLPLKEDERQGDDLVDIDLGLKTTKSVKFSGVFGFFLRAAWTKFLFRSIAHLILFPITAAFFAAESLVSLIDLIKAKNRNASRWISLLISLVSFALIFTAVLVGTLGLITYALFTPILFITSCFINTLVNIGFLIGNIFQYFKAKATGAPTQERYKEKIKEYVIGTIMSALFTVGVGLLMVFKVPPLVMTITAAISGALGIIGAALGMKGAYDTYKARKDKKTNEADELKPGEPAANNAQFNVKNYIQEQKHKWDFYFKVDRAKEVRLILSSRKQLADGFDILNELKNIHDGAHGVAIKFDNDDNIAHAKLYLAAEIIEKIMSLQKQIEEAGTSHFEKTKREDKIDALYALLALIVATTKQPANAAKTISTLGNTDPGDAIINAIRDQFKNKNGASFIRLANSLKNPSQLAGEDIYNVDQLMHHRQYKSKFDNNVFHSFLKETGDVQDIFKGAEQLFDYIRNHPILAENLQNNLQPQV